MARTYLVTGGLGFIGASLCQALVGAGHNVRILDNLLRGAATRLGTAHAACEIIIGDIRQPETVDRAVRGVDTVCHLAAVNGTRNFYERPKLVLEVAVKGMLHVLDACLRHDVGDVIVASSSEVYQTPPVVPTDEQVPLSIPDVFNPRYSYAGGKIASELLAINYAREKFERMVIVRPHNVYGPNMGWAHVIPEFVTRMLQAQAARPGSSSLVFPIQGDGQQTRSFMFIDDFVDALLQVAAAGRHQNIYHIGTSDERSIREVAELVAGCLGIEASVVAGPAAPGGTNRRCPDVAKLAALGFSPRVSFEEGLRRTVAWYAEHWLAQTNRSDQLAG